MLKLRPYKKCDAETIVSWILNEKEFYSWSAGILGEYPYSAERLEAFSAEIADSDSVFQFVACEENELIGYMIMRYTDEEKQTLRFGFIIADPKVRGTGLGKKMLRQAMHYAFEFLKVKRITLGVFADNLNAFHCYQAAGFWEMRGTDTQSYDILGEKWVCKEMVAYPRNTEYSVNEKNYPEEKLLDEIITTNSFRYAFQPIIEAATGNIFGYEVLMRADYNGPIAPLVVLDYATKYGRLHDIERATIKNTLQLVRQQKDLLAGKRIFVNCIPGQQLNKQEYGEIIKNYDGSLDQFVVEITENAELPENEWQALMAMSKAYGIQIAVDDYGTGYSNTTNLLKHMPNYVKIDHLLISNIQDDAKKRHFVSSMIDFAHTNGFLALAEGVETLTELRTVIQLGVDYIQGYYTGRPSFDIIQEIPAEIRNEIIRTNVSEQTVETRKVYVVKNEKELPLLRVALEQYTGMLISSPEFTLVGNPEYKASMSIKIQDNTDCRLTLRSVSMEGFQDLPCIELGENVNLTLVLEEDNVLDKTGICVPEGSSLKIEGLGNLYVHGKGVQRYAIGNGWESTVGKISLNCSGTIRTTVEADYGICIGGGVAGKNSAVEIVGGVLQIEPLSANSIGIGGVKGGIPITIKDCHAYMDMRVDRGEGIGCLSGPQNISIVDSKLRFKCSGAFVGALGSYQNSDGKILINRSDCTFSGNAQQVYLVGAPSGKMDIEVKDSSMDMNAEGSEVLGFGTRDRQSTITMKNANNYVKIRSGEHMMFGAWEPNIHISGGIQNLSANE